MSKNPKRPRDPIQFAKMIGDMATGIAPKETLQDGGKNPAAVALGSMGGRARAASLSKKKRSEIAKKAAQARWKD